jgi:hypothetical protein
MIYSTFTYGREKKEPILTVTTEWTPVHGKFGERRGTMPRQLSPWVGGVQDQDTDHKELFGQEMWLIINITTENLWRDKWIVNEKTS